jgi:predicted ATPase
MRERSVTTSRQGAATPRTEIRPSTVDELLEKVRNHNYGKYLLKLSLASVRGFSDQTVRFDFPVTALIGPNGGGKTTILGAAACAYNEIKPRLFFAKSGKFDDSMRSWTIEYELTDRSVNQRDTVRRTASFRRAKWNRHALSRPTLVFGVARTVPANERVELRKCASNQFTVPSGRIETIQPEVVTAAQRILGKDISRYSRIQVDSRGRVSLLAGVTETGIGYSEFHFGAGESSIIRMVIQIEALPDNGLILIEEIENGLHPVATVRMVEYLIDVARRKKAQAIFTTHSNDALFPLPSQAIWAAVGGDIFQGKLDIRALRAITGQIDAKLVVFVEDDFARDWIEVALRYYSDVALDAIEVHAMAGDGMAVKVNTHHNLDPTATFPSVCYIDGDSRQTDSANEKIFRLPGESPESYIFRRILDRIDEAAGKLAVALHLPFEQQEKAADVVRHVNLINSDPHLLFSQVGERLGLISEKIVRSAFLSLWAQLYPDEVNEIIGKTDDLLPREGDGTAETSIEEELPIHDAPSVGATHSDSTRI